ncbi:MAG: ECF transporter S component [Clostridiales bacterium]|nr:ECF transporter S component [Clostridiales bacterium]
MSKDRSKILSLSQLGVLAAILILMAFTPLGYLKTPLIEISLNMVPVVIGAIVIGPTAGAILGGIFGVTSFIQCFGMSAFGTFLMTINPVLTFIMCLVPRILAGLLAGLIFKGIGRFDKTKVVAAGVSSTFGALLNTIFFMLSIYVLFWNNNSFISKMTEWGLPVGSFAKFLIAFVGINGVIEAAVCLVAGTAISKALLVLNKKVAKT